VITVNKHFTILKMTAITSGCLTALDCTKFVFGRGSAADPAGRAYSTPPDSPAGLRGTLLLRGREGELRGGERRGNGPLPQSPGSTPDNRPRLCIQAPGGLQSLQQLKV